MGQVKVLAVGSIKKDAAWTGRLILGIMQSLVAVVIGIAYYVVLINFRFLSAPAGPAYVRAALSELFLSFHSHINAS